MASKIAAINHYRPRIEYGKTAGWRDIADEITERTGFNRSEIIAILFELQNAIIHFNRFGQGARLEGLGIYLPQVNYRGEYDISYRLDSGLKQALNNNFSGSLVNKKHIGKTTEQVVALWNSEDPDDLVEA